MGPPIRATAACASPTTGSLETLNGNAVLDAGGAPILLNPSAGSPTIAGDGMIAQDGKQIGAIGLFAIDDDAKLTRAENSGVVPDKPATPILDFTKTASSRGSSKAPTSIRSRR